MRRDRRGLITIPSRMALKSDMPSGQQWMGLAYMHAVDANGPGRASLITGNRASPPPARVLMQWPWPFPVVLQTRPDEI